MTKNKNDASNYVQRVRDETQHYIVELLESNEKLRLKVATIETEVERFREEKLRLQEQVMALRERQESFLEDQNRLQARLVDAEVENQRFSERFVAVEEHNNNLAHLYVASYRLHETVDHEEVLSVLQEIIVNLVGSEAFAILEKESTGSSLKISSSFGLDQDMLDSLNINSGPVARTAETGELYIAQETPPRPGPAGQPDVLACVPLRLGELILGVIVIVRLLPHKVGLEPLDFELFDLIASQAATSLCVSQLQASAARPGIAG